MSIPAFPDKHAGASLLTPEHFADYHRREGAYRDFAPPVAAILCYHRGLAEHLAARRAMTRIEGFFGDTFLVEETGGKVALVANFGIGAPVAAVMLEDLAALGVREVISIGTTGALQPGLAIGDVVVCERALRDEGTSHHYLPAARYADASRSLTQRLLDAFTDLGTTVTCGSSWTTDAPYRETAAEVVALQGEGVTCVEMEAAALFAVGAYRDVEVASALAISDTLAEVEGWEPAFHAADTLAGLETLFEAALRTLAASPVTRPGR